MNAIMCLRVARVAAALGAVVLATSEALAQMPGIPVLQNAFANPGLTIAINYGSGDNLRAYGGAVAWAPNSTRFQVTGGFGAINPDPGDRTTAWGARAAVPIVQSMAAGKLGIGAFAGVGGASQDGTSLLHVPAGASLSWRMRLGDRRGVSIYAAPFYSWMRTKIDDESNSTGLFRASFGLDVTVISSLGLTIGYELGQTADDGEPGATGGVFGVGVSYALRRGQ